MKKCRANDPNTQKLELGVLLRTGEDGSRVIVGVLHDPMLLRTALEKLVESASKGAATAMNPLAVRSSFAQLRVYRELLGHL